MDLPNGVTGYLRSISAATDTADGAEPIETHRRWPPLHLIGMSQQLTQKPRKTPIRENPELASSVAQGPLENHASSAWDSMVQYASRCVQPEKVEKK